MSNHETETLQPLTNADLPVGLSWTPGMVDRFFDGYLECALWSSTDESDESGGKPMDCNYGPEETPGIRHVEPGERSRGYRWPRHGRVPGRARCGARRT